MLMADIHTLKFLPSTPIIQTISAFGEELEDDSVEFKQTFISLKNCFKAWFMNNQDHSTWVLTWR
jgi:hypothetical protein